MLQDSDCKAVFYSDDYSDKIKKCTPSMPWLNMKNIQDMIAQGKESIDSGRREYLELMPDKHDLA